MKAKISEIFKSIQGEGVYQGVEQVFVRFFGCPLHCHFCDTELYTYQEKTIGEILQEIHLYKDYHSVSLTGGEPLLQAYFLKELAQCLKNSGKKVYLETNGILFQELREVIDYVDIVAMDFKLPSSTGLKDFWSEHREFLKISLKKEVFIKAVVGKNTIIDDILKAIEVIKESNSNTPFVLQPENPFEDLLTHKLEYFRNICQEEGINVKIVSQLHKKLGIK